MSRTKTKLCLGCRHVFDGRRDAKTCSAKCRKRYQRAKELYVTTPVYELERITITQRFEQLKARSLYGN